MNIVLGAALIVCVALLIKIRMQTRKIISRLNRMLDEALRGEFLPENYDETELSKLEAKFSRFLNASRLQQNKFLHEQDKIRSLISDISHQTKTPICNILLYTQLLNEQDLPEDTKILGGQIMAGAEKLNFLIQSLIKTSRLESGLISVAPRKADVCALVLSVIEECSLKAQEKGITLLAESLPDMLYGFFDSKWCGEMLYNILDNALKYTAAGGQVRLSVKAYEMFVCIKVADTGCGIQEANKTKVFNRFWRADPESEGVGIGLYLAREIASACGGYIKVSSTVGVGSVFFIYLPAV